jgi:hypothetical protein
LVIISEAILNRFNIVTAECECGDGLQMEKCLFWDCKPYEVQTATIIGVMSERSKKEHPKTVKELLRHPILQKQNS